MLRIVFDLISPLAVSVALLGVVLMLWKREGRATLGRRVAAAALLILLFAGNGYVARFGLSILEDRYPVFAAGTPANRDIRHVVVLAGSISDDEDLPITSQLSGTLVRLVEGIRVHKAIPGSILVLSGEGSRNEDVEPAGRLEELSMVLGAAPGDLVVEDQASNTYEQALAVAKIVGERPFVLVTAARHMPRAMALFEEAGTHPIAAPTDHLAKTAAGESAILSLIPTARHLMTSTQALYEYAALTKEFILGRT